MGGKVEKVGTAGTTYEPQTILEAENSDKIPRGFTMYLSEQIVNAIRGKGPKDPLKILSNALNNYSNSPYYKIFKRSVKKTGEAAIWLLDKASLPINKDIPPYGLGSFDMNQKIYM